MPPALRALGALALVVAAGSPAAAQTYAVAVKAVAGGGGAAGAGGSYTLDGTIGQVTADAPQGGGTLTVSPGFWPAVVPPPDVNLLRNGGFADGTAGWVLFATPDLSHLVSNVVNGALEFFWVPPPAGTVGQAVVFQPTTEALSANAPVVASFDLGNSSSVRKRISVLVHDLNFTDLSVCTFWLAPATARATYGLRTHTTRAWANATVSIYAATTGSDGGTYELDNVSLRYAPAGASDRTECVDPALPAGGGSDGADLIQNGDFSSGALAPWGVFGQIVHQVAGGVLEFYRPPGTPSGVVLQNSGQPVAAGERVTATFDLGNSSSVRKRVTVLLHDGSFADLSACTFWLEPGDPLQSHVMKSWATQAWSQATVSVYPATVGIEPWIRLDNVTLRRTPSAAMVGTECIEPGPSPDAPAPLTAARGQADALRRPAEPLEGRESGARAIDLRDVVAARWRLHSWLVASGGAGTIEASLDGRHWAPIQAVAPSETWVPVEIDLAEFAGRVVYVRFVLPMDDIRAVWRLAGFEIEITSRESAARRWH